MDTPGEDNIQKEFHGASNNWLIEAEKELPFGQLVKTSEISPLICYLISSGSGIITGSIIDYDQNSRELLFRIFHDLNSDFTYEVSFSGLHTDSIVTYNDLRDLGLF